MRVLLLHPDDSPRDVAWAERRWDLVVDLAWAGWLTAERWGARLGGRVLSLYDWAREVEDARHVGRILSLGRGRLIDSEGLDWWELASPLMHHDFEALLLIGRLAESLRHAKEIVVSRPCRDAHALGVLLGREIRSLSHRAGDGSGARLRRYGQALVRLSAPQLLQSALDKWDPTYRLRRWVAPRRRRRTPGAVVLAPSAYVNVSRALGDYARMAPDRRFLLVTTRRSGRLAGLPPNVVTASLASYASPASSRRRETEALGRAWDELRETLVRDVPEVALADRARLFTMLPAVFHDGLQLRDAWRRVFEREDVRAVFCGDDSNPHTRIPLMLGTRRGLPTVWFHHGALDARMIIKPHDCGVYLAKGEMERDYLVNVCGLSPEKIVLGAPHLGRAPAGPSLPRRREGSRIIFFSEPYEVCRGRADEVYGDLLPPLCRVAERSGRRLVVKLHPFESRRERTRLVNRVLTAEQRRQVSIVEGPLSPALVRDTWFAVTVESSVAVECTLWGVPCFLCGWLRGFGQGYARQYAKFGAGQMLGSPEEIDDLVSRVELWHADPDASQALWRPIGEGELDRLLSGAGPGVRRAALG